MMQILSSMDLLHLKEIEAKVRQNKELVQECEKALQENGHDFTEKLTKRKKKEPPTTI